MEIFFRLAPPQAVKKPVWGGLEGPQALQNEIVSLGFAGRAGSLRPPWAQTFLKILAEKAGAGGLFRHAEAARDGIFSDSRRSFCF